VSIFLLEYEPSTQRVIGGVRRYEQAERAEAQAERLRLEKENVRGGLRREVVLLEAINREALKATHGRYFKTTHDFICPVAAD
jgi:hypothetical protein